jgi:nicotinate-nucleotide adenylyltransferase
MKIGLFFGSFNPVHVGHMVIGGYMAEFTDLEKVWFVISPHNPLKEKVSLLADYHRRELVRRAIGDTNKLKASNIEFNLPKPSYTIHTLTYLTEKYPGDQFVLIMGSDTLGTFHKWKNYTQILEGFELYVYPRAGVDGGELKNHPHVKMVDTPLMEISSSFIRDAIKQKKDIRYMLPESVYNYISEMHFYEK